MKLISILGWTKRNNQLGFEKIENRTKAESNREDLIKQTGEQFKKLSEKGLSIPVALL